MDERTQNTCSRTVMFCSVLFCSAEHRTEQNTKIIFGPEHRTEQNMEILLFFHPCPRFQIKVPPASFLKRMNSISTAAATIEEISTPTGQLPFVKPESSLPTPKTIVTSLSVPEIQKLTGPNPTSHHINLAIQSDLLKLCDEIINIISYQKEVNHCCPDHSISLFKLFRNTKSRSS